MFNFTLPHWTLIHTIIFDFDGVFTDNKVWIDQSGSESICCSRGDGLAFDLLKKFILKNNWSLRYFILSKEKNPVVQARASKLGVQCVHGCSDKSLYLQAYLQDNQVDPNGVIYVGNDLNDLGPMRLVGYSVAPSDAHPLILKQASFVFPQKGGDSFVRSFIELLLDVEHMPIEDIIELF